MLPLYFLSSCAIVFCVILTPSAHSSVHTASSLPHLFLLGAYLGVTWVFLRGVFSIFFCAAIYCSIFVSIRPSHILAAIFLFLVLARSPSGCGLLLIALRLFSLSLSPLLCIGTPAAVLLAAPVGSVSLAVLRSPASHPPLFSCPQFTTRCRCCACRSPLLATCLPSPVVWGAVLCAYFLLLLLSFACAFLGGVCYSVRFPHSLGFFFLTVLVFSFSC